MKRTAPSLLTVALILCGAAARAEPSVVASIKPVHSLVSAVMQGVGQPTLIVDGAGSPHTYALKPSQAAALSRADVVFWIGQELEAFLEKPVHAISHRAMSVELMDSPGLVKLTPREGGAFEAHDHDGDHAKDHDHDKDHDKDRHDAVDPHVWLDPVNAKAAVAAISDALAKADPGNAQVYAANAAAAVAGLGALADEIAATLAPVEGRRFMVFHDAYQYFEARFGMPATGALTVSPDVMPGASRLMEIRERLKKLEAACVFAEPQFPPKLIAVAIEGTSARSGVIDPLGAALDPGPDLYGTLIRNMAASIRGCLS